jgi:hypothetical protein
LDGVDFPTAVASIIGQRPAQRRKTKPAHNMDDAQVSEPAQASVDDVNSPDRPVGDSAADKIKKAQWLWCKRQPTKGTPAEKYLRNVRGYRGPIRETLGWLPPYQDFPGCLVAPFGLPDEPEPGRLAMRADAVTGLLLIYLKTDGTKADIENSKQFRGQCKGTPVVLAPVNDLGGLLIAEGIEDALTGHEATGLGAWAAGCANFLPDLAARVPDYVEAVSIVQDDDAAGRKYSPLLAQQLIKRGIEVRLIDAGRAP